MNQARPYTSSAVAGCAHSQDAASRYSSLEHVVREGLAFARLKGMGATMDREVSLHSLSTHSRAITGSHISSCELCLSRADKPCCLSSMAWTSSHLSCHLFPEDFKDLGCWVMRESGACPAWCSDRQLDLPAPWWQTNRQGRGIRAGGPKQRRSSPLGACRGVRHCTPATWDHSLAARWCTPSLTQQKAPHIARYSAATYCNKTTMYCNNVPQRSRIWRNHSSGGHRPMGLPPRQSQHLLRGAGADACPVGWTHTRVESIGAVAPDTPCS